MSDYERHDHIEPAVMTEPITEELFEAVRGPHRQERDEWREQATNAGALASRYEAERNEAVSLLRDFQGFLATSYGTTSEAHVLRGIQDDIRDFLRSLTEGEGQ